MSLTHVNCTLQVCIAKYTSYFSAASANAATTGKLCPSRSISFLGYIYANRRASTSAGSVNCTISPCVSMSDPGNAPVLTSKRRRCIWNINPSDDWTSISESKTLTCWINHWLACIAQNFRGRYWHLVSTHGCCTEMSICDEFFEAKEKFSVAMEVEREFDFMIEWVIGWPDRVPASSPLN